VRWNSREAQNEFDEHVLTGKEKRKLPNHISSPLAQIGAKIQVSMMEGSVADDSILVSLAVESIRKATSNDSEMGGWILVDFPRTKSQAQLLEKELSG
jgi:adenylate kinase family enzyme